MKIFLDTASVSEIKKWVSTGLIDGVTTNPTLLSREEAKNPLVVLKEICDIVPGPVSAEVTERGEDAMVEQGRFLSRISPNIVVKVPLTVEGLRACRVLRMDGIAVNVTLCFSLPQGILAMKAGATYLSPFIGRLEDHGEAPYELLEDLHVYCTDNSSMETQILAASIRSVDHAVKAIQSGAHVMTVPPSIFEKLYQHPLTEKGMEIFEKDWGKLSSEARDAFFPQKRKGN